MTPTTTHEMMEQLDAQGAYDELIQHWDSIEKKAFPTSMSYPLPLQACRTTLRFVCFLADTMDLASPAWFRAAVLLETACLQVDGGRPLKDLAIAAAFLVVLVKKEDTVAFSSYGPHLQAQILQFRRCFNS